MLLLDNNERVSDWLGLLFVRNEPYRVCSGFPCTLKEQAESPGPKLL